MIIVLALLSDNNGIFSYNRISDHKQKTQREAVFFVFIAFVTLNLNGFYKDMSFFAE